MMERKSPFSLENEWTFKPTILPDDTLPGYAPLRAGIEVEGLSAIGKIGCIGSVQIQRLFGWRRHQVRRMLDEKKLVQHLLIKNKNTIPVYTVGLRSVQLFDLSLSINFWRNWSTERIVSSLVFFQFCCALREKQKAFQISSAPSPFTGRVEIDKHVRDVLILRGQKHSLENALHHLSNPVIVIAEKLEEVVPLNLHLKDAKLLLDKQLDKEYKFYQLVNGKWQLK